MKFFKVILVLVAVASVTLADNLKEERSKESHRGLTNAHQVKDRDSDEGTDNPSTIDCIKKMIAKFCELLTEIEKVICKEQHSKSNNTSGEDGNNTSGENGNNTSGENRNNTSGEDGNNISGENGNNSTPNGEDKGESTTACIKQRIAKLRELLTKIEKEICNILKSKGNNTSGEDGNNSSSDEENNGESTPACIKRLIAEFCEEFTELEKNICKLLNGNGNNTTEQYENSSASDEEHKGESTPACIKRLIAKFRELLPKFEKIICKFLSSNGDNTTEEYDNSAAPDDEDKGEPTTACIKRFIAKFRELLTKIEKIICKIQNSKGNNTSGENGNNTSGENGNNTSGENSNNTSGENGNSSTPNGEDKGETTTACIKQRIAKLRELLTKIEKEICNILKSKGNNTSGEDGNNSSSDEENNGESTPACIKRLIAEFCEEFTELEKNICKLLNGNGNNTTEQYENSSASDEEHKGESTPACIKRLIAKFRELLPKFEKIICKLLSSNGDNSTEEYDNSAAHDDEDKGDSTSACIKRIIAKLCKLLTRIEKIICKSNNSNNSGEYGNNTSGENGSNSAPNGEDKEESTIACIKQIIAKLRELLIKIKKEICKIQKIKGNNTSGENSNNTSEENGNNTSGEYGSGSTSTEEENEESTSTCIKQLIAEFREQLAELKKAICKLLNSNGNNTTIESSTHNDEVEPTSKAITTEGEDVASTSEPIPTEGKDIESTSIHDEVSTENPEGSTSTKEAADRSRSRNSHSAVRARLAHGHNKSKSQKSHSKSKSHGSKSHAKTKNHVKGHSKLSKSHGQKKN